VCSRLRQRFNDFCDKVGQVNDARRKQARYQEHREELMDEPPHPLYLSYLRSLNKDPGSFPNAPRVCFHGCTDALTCFYCRVLATNITATVPLMCGQRYPHWPIYQLAHAFGGQEIFYTQHEWDKEEEEEHTESSLEQPAWSEYEEEEEPPAIIQPTPYDPDLGAWGIPAESIPDEELPYGPDGTWLSSGGSSPPPEVGVEVTPSACCPAGLGGTSDSHSD
jgi:hypothetical protein